MAGGGESEDKSEEEEDLEEESQQLPWSKCDSVNGIPNPKLKDDWETFSLQQKKVTLQEFMKKIRSSCERQQHLRGKQHNLSHDPVPPRKLEALQQVGKKIS